MNFGAQVLAGGGVRFRLWAPAAARVEVVIDGTRLPMKASGDGWFEREERAARAGTLYRYCIDDEVLVPDPASRFQPQDCEGPSEVIDPAAFPWKDGWKGRPWSEAVVYELHVGTFSPRGDYRGVAEKLPHLASLGVTAIELMPLSDFAGRRNWGYDGVLPYAPDSAYGRPEDLKALVQTAHDRGLMVLLDVVYNHFGPKGNFLGRYAPQFFTARHRTPWGAAINFDGEGSRWVREYFIQNALYWLGEYRLDGLRFDAVHAIIDQSPRHVLDELAFTVRKAFQRPIHLVLENDLNQARYMGPAKYTAQWNDDSHHGYHVLATGEDDGYYVAYADAPAKHLARSLAEGFAYQGEVSPFTGEKRGEPSTHVPPSAFVDFLQNHDQVGNRAFGERLLSLSDEKVLRALTAILLLAPSPPMLFMGEEWGCTQPFLFFCDFDGELGEAVRDGRRAEFARFAAFRDPAARARIPDPIAEPTFRRSALDWSAAQAPAGKAWVAFYAELLALRRAHIWPLRPGPGRHRMAGERAFHVDWPLQGGGTLRLAANLGERPEKLALEGRPFHVHGTPGEPWSVAWTIA
ncbi:MAG TPA: malto-oligosyltrehalose trehalohydrolase [Burkholderiales bacterium]|nr:malto-oligosyltrehalose trehalohydrolase [Burkholderiales bacterium]